MRNIATANGVMRADIGRYATRLTELGERGYVQEVPETDAWGTPWVYSGDTSTYTFASLGSDGASGPAPPRVWVDAPYDPDIVTFLGGEREFPGRRGGATVSSGKLPPANSLAGGAAS